MKKAPVHRSSTRLAATRSDPFGQFSTRFRAKLIASDPAIFEGRFGGSVAISGNTAIIGATACSNQGRGLYLCEQRICLD
ncbi:MAG: FG-GAP repeat protein [Acidobacteria bacterium]|nr:FG-GAP repeat protein [Acidobacteriota bacterium]